MQVARELARRIGQRRAHLLLGALLLAGLPARAEPEAREVALVIESMKLEHSLSVRADAQVAELLVAEGQQVSPGQVLLRLAAPATQEAAQ